MTVTVSLITIIAIMLAIYTTLTHLFNWWTREADEEESAFPIILQIIIFIVFIIITHFLINNQ